MAKLSAKTLAAAAAKLKPIIDTYSKKGFDTFLNSDTGIDALIEDILNSGVVKPNGKAYDESDLRKLFETYRKTPSLRDDPTLQNTGNSATTAMQYEALQRVINSRKQDTYDTSKQRLQKSKGLQAANIARPILKNIGDFVGTALPQSSQLLGNALQAATSMLTSQKERDQYGGNFLDVIGALSNAATQTKGMLTGLGIKAGTDSAAQIINDIDSEENLIRMLAEQAANGHSGSMWQGMGTIMNANNKMNK